MKEDKQPIKETIPEVSKDPKKRKSFDEMTRSEKLALQAFKNVQERKAKQ